MQTSGFFDADIIEVEGELQFDREYLASAFASYFSDFISNGIYGGILDQLYVTADTPNDMSVLVRAGKAYVNGYWYSNDGVVEFAIDNQDGILNRIDTIVVRYDVAERVINLQLIKGTPGTIPVAPEIVRDASYYDLKLCDIYVDANAFEVKQINITDTRFDNEVCGLVAAVVNQIDTTEFNNQLTAFLDSFRASGEGVLAVFEQDAMAALNLFESNSEQALIDLQAAIDSIFAGEDVMLKSQYDRNGVGKDIFDEIAKVELKANHTITHEKAGTVHTLTGMPTELGIYNIQFLATAVYNEGDTFTDGTNTWTAKTVGSSEPLSDESFLQGDVVSVTIDVASKIVSFKSGGGGGGEWDTDWIVITETQIWNVPSNATDILVSISGAGGKGGKGGNGSGGEGNYVGSSGGSGGGGGAGIEEYGIFTREQVGDSVQITIGESSSQQSSFGALLTADGGGQGTDGTNAYTSKASTNPGNGGVGGLGMYNGSNGLRGNAPVGYTPGTSVAGGVGGVSKNHGSHGGNGGASGAGNYVGQSGYSGKVGLEGQPGSCKIKCRRK